MDHERAAADRYAVDPFRREAQIMRDRHRQFANPCLGQTKTADSHATGCASSQWIGTHDRVEPSLHSLPRCQIAENVIRKFFVAIVVVSATAPGLRAPLSLLCGTLCDEPIPLQTEGRGWGRRARGDVYQRRLQG